MSQWSIHWGHFNLGLLFADGQNKMIHPGLRLIWIVTFSVISSVRWGSEKVERLNTKG